LAPEPDFGTFFSGENSAENFAENFPQKLLGKIEFSAEKVLKNRFSNNFRGKFRGKKCTKNRPLVSFYVGIEQKPSRNSGNIFFWEVFFAFPCILCSFQM
jgi:hypothetical protein